MRIRVTTPNRMLVIKNVPVRTPLDIDIKSKAEEEYMKAYLRTECAEYIIIDEELRSSNVKTPSSNIKTKEILDSTIKIEEDKTEPVIEELKGSRILDTILND